MNSLWQTLLRPDREENPDRADMVKAANILQVGEFQFLQLAYRDWFGREMPESAANGVFRRFIVQGNTPHWARLYASRILDWDARSLLDENNPEYHRYDSDYYSNVQHGTRRFAVALAFLIFALGGGLALSHYAVTRPDSKGTSVVSPYFDEKELRPKVVKTDIRGS